MAQSPRVSAKSGERPDGDSSWSTSLQDGEYDTRLKIGPASPGGVWIGKVKVETHSADLKCKSGMTAGWSGRRESKVRIPKIDKAQISITKGCLHFRVVLLSQHGNYRQQNKQNNSDDLYHRISSLPSR